MIDPLRTIHAPAGATWEISSILQDEQWDSFVENQPMGHHEQTSLWGEVKRAYGWKPLRLILKENDNILAGVQLLMRRIWPLGLIGYVSKGPVIGNSVKEFGQHMAKALHSFAKYSRVFYLVIELPYDGHDIGRAFDQLHYGPIPESLPPSGLTHATQVIDLSQTTDAMLLNMRSSTRGNIRRSLRRGIVVTEAHDGEWWQFRPLMLKICTRRGVGPTPPQHDFFDRLAKTFGRKRRAVLLFAKYQDEIISAAIAFPFGRYVRQWKVGWTGSHSELFPNEAINWGVMNWAKDHGYAFYENVQLDYTNASRILDGAKLAKQEWEPTTFFKLGFGGKILMLPEPRACIYNPLMKRAAMTMDVLRKKPKLAK